TTCSQGVCQRACPQGLALCDDDCVDTSRDDFNCGACGVTCNGSCQASSCIATAWTNVPANKVGALYARAGDLYYADLADAEILQASPSGGIATPVATNVPRASALAVDGGVLYWTDYLGGAVMRKTLPNGQPELISAATQPGFLQLDDSEVFWLDGANIK